MTVEDVDDGVMSLKEIKLRAHDQHTLSWQTLPESPSPPERNSLAGSQKKSSKHDLMYPSFMSETNGGGRLENVPGFDVNRALLAGLSGTNPLPQLRLDRLNDGLETVAGDDDRVPIRNTAAVPWRSICHLIIDRENGARTFGTAWFAGPSLLATAGHCILDHDNGGWAVNITIVPGSNGAQPPPFGLLTPKNIFVDPRWVKKRDYSYDYGLLSLSSTSLGSKLGWFGVAAFNDDKMQQILLNNSGYPHDKPYGTQWFNAGRVYKVERHFISYMIDTEEGQSGSPIFFYNDRNERIVVAIHTRAGLPNRGVRITPEIFKTFMAANRAK